MKGKKYLDLRDHCHYAGEYRGTGYSILKCSEPEKILLFFIIDLTLIFIIIELAEEFKKQFNCLG